MKPLHIQLKVKFRAFGVDLARYDKQWVVTPAMLELSEEPVTVTLPGNAKKHLDRNGVKVFSWTE